MLLTLRPSPLRFAFFLLVAAFAFVLDPGVAEIGHTTGVDPVAIACQSHLTPAQRAARDQERAQQRQEKHCARLQSRLDRINRQLDAGYREPRGNELRRQRRELQSQLFRDCH